MVLVLVLALDRTRCTCKTDFPEGVVAATLRLHAETVVQSRKLRPMPSMLSSEPR